MSPAPEEVLVHWQGYRSLVEAIGAPGIGEVLLTAFNDVADIDEVFAFQAPAAGAPTPLASAGERPGAATRAALYSEEFYKLDPARNVIPAHLPGGLLARRVPAEAVKDDGYRQACFDQPGLAEKMSFAMGGANPYVLSLYCLRRRPRMSDSRYAAVGRLAQIALPLIRKHAQLVGGLGPEASPEQRLERRLDALDAGLSPRELSVCARTMTGRTAGAIAAELGVGVTSVLTYRRRAYARLGVSGAGEILARLLSSHDA
jgi:DNA-binding CsgD family transcriptional regulator